ncbi:MAG: hypothetical protein CVU05_07420 [Bacteroidetes bacterium HGW-Bacteroidetes-21]|nr:MAG: hypothetical protein CVU05_07420 [Bacteroidetes bacterium HGW-Bacteroidetes-21]
MKTSKKTTFKTFLLFSGWMLIAQYAISQTKDSIISLNTCIELCIKNNLKLQQANLETKKLQYLYKEAIGTGFPQIKGYGSMDDCFEIPTTLIPGDLLGQPGTILPVKMGAQYNSSVGIEAGQIIYNRSYFLSLKLFRKSYNLSNLNLQKVKEELAYNVAQIYFIIQYSNHQLALLDSSITSIEKVYKIAKQNFNNGQILKIDLDRVSVAAGNLEAEKANLISINKQQLNMLKLLIGMKLNESLTLSGNNENFETILNLSDSTFSSNTEVAIIEQQTELAKINLKLSQSEYLPSLTGYFSYGFQAQCEKFDALNNSKNWNNTGFVGLKLYIPIFKGFQIENKISQNKIEIEQSVIGISDIKNELNLNYLNAVEKYKASKIASEKAYNNMILSKNIYEVTCDLYQQGIKSLTDALNAQTEYHTSQLSWYQTLLQSKIIELEILKTNDGIRSLFITL